MAEQTPETQSVTSTVKRKPVDGPQLRMTITGDTLPAKRQLKMAMNYSFASIIRTLKQEGQLYWNGVPLDPKASPLKVGMEPGDMELVFVAKPQPTDEHPGGAPPPLAAAPPSHASQRSDEPPRDTQDEPARATTSPVVPRSDTAEGTPSGSGAQTPIPGETQQKTGASSPPKVPTRRPPAANPQPQASTTDAGDRAPPAKSPPRARPKAAEPVWNQPPTETAPVGRTSPQPSVASRRSEPRSEPRPRPVAQPGGTSPSRRGEALSLPVNDRINEQRTNTPSQRSATPPAQNLVPKPRQQPQPVPSESSTLTSQRQPTHPQPQQQRISPAPQQPAPPQQPQPHQQPVQQQPYQQQPQQAMRTPDRRQEQHSASDQHAAVEATPIHQNTASFTNTPSSNFRLGPGRSAGPPRRQLPPTNVAAPPPLKPWPDQSPMHMFTRDEMYAAHANLQKSNPAVNESGSRYGDVSFAAAAATDERSGFGRHDGGWAVQTGAVSPTRPPAPVHRPGWAHGSQQDTIAATKAQLHRGDYHQQQTVDHRPAYNAAPDVRHHEQPSRRSESPAAAPVVKEDNPPSPPHTTVINKTVQGASEVEVEALKEEIQILRAELEIEKSQREHLASVVRQLAKALKENATRGAAVNAEENARLEAARLMEQLKEQRIATRASRSSSQQSPVAGAQTWATTPPSTGGHAYRIPGRG